MDDEKPLLTLKTKVDAQAIRGDRGKAGAEAGSAPSHQSDRADNLPLMGVFAVGFGLLSIFLFAPLFVPLGLILGIVALFIGQVGLGVSAILLSLVGIATSPTLVTLLSIGAFLGWLGL